MPDSERDASSQGAERLADALRLFLGSFPALDDITPEMITSGVAALEGDMDRSPFAVASDVYNAMRAKRPAVVRTEAVRQELIRALLGAANSLASI